LCVSHSAVFVIGTPLRSALFPYTTLFRSVDDGPAARTVLLDAPEVRDARSRVLLRLGGAVARFGVRRDDLDGEQHVLRRVARLARSGDRVGADNAHIGLRAVAPVEDDGHLPPDSEPGRHSL